MRQGAADRNSTPPNRCTTFAAPVWRRWLDVFVEDARLLPRFVRRSPGFVSLAVLSVALAVGTSTTVYTLVDALFFRMPAGITSGSTLHRVYPRASRSGALAGGSAHVSWPQFFALERAQHTVAALTGYTDPGALRLGPDIDAPTIKTSAVTGNYFTVLGVHPALGRLLSEDDDRDDGGPIAAVLSYDAWKSKFGADRSVIGKTLIVHDHPMVVVGVAQPGFTGLDVDAAEVWYAVAPMMRSEFGPSWRSIRFLVFTNVVMRLRPGVEEAAAQAGLQAALRALPPAGPHARRDPFDGIVLGSLIRARGPLAPSASLSIARDLALAALLMLLAGCLNLAHLLFARLLARPGELAVRVALGASRGRLIAQLLGETLFLCGAGGLAAIALARAGGGVLRATVLPDITWNAGPVDAHIVIVTLAATVIFGVIAAVVPGWRMAHTDPRPALASGGAARGSTGQRMREWALVVQIALAATLLVGAGLFTQSLIRASHIDPGFDADHAVVVRMGLRGAHRSSTALAAMVREASDRIRSRARSGGASTRSASASASVRTPFRAARWWAWCGISCPAISRTVRRRPTSCRPSSWRALTAHHATCSPAWMAMSRPPSPGSTRRSGRGRVESCQRSRCSRFAS